MLIYEGNKHPVYVKLLLHYGPYQGWVGIFAYSVFAIIVGFNVKGHRAISAFMLTSYRDFSKT